MNDVEHLTDKRPHGHCPLTPPPWPNGSPRIYEEIQLLRIMAQRLEHTFYVDSASLDTTTYTPETTTSPAPVDAPTTTTYSSAVKTATSLPESRPPAAKTQTKNPRQKPRVPNKVPPPPTLSRSAPQRLILRFTNSSTIKTVSDPQRLCDTLNDTLNGASKVRAVNLSRGGNLVLHAQEPGNAVQLHQHEQTIWAVIRQYFSLLERDRPRFNRDKPWQRIVIHRVPVREDNGRTLVEELCWSNEGIGALADVMGVRDLCSLVGMQKRREGLRQGIPQEATLMVMLLNADAARRFLREGGVHGEEGICLTLPNSLVQLKY
ncbi:hypothetical protein GGX14DRAFT_475937 [Mycena pura]|uniref:Uncharacterized protein n=1 Tax=Mycena pura TaxID=153505 RepID=A0AAD6Y7G5_9AGAR|nr:hypothetical protein GGX14DRAFT_475937 [Mycena pura]